LMGFVFPSNTSKACKIKKQQLSTTTETWKQHTHTQTHPKKTLFFNSFCVTELRKFVKKETHVLNSEWESVESVDCGLVGYHIVRYSNILLQPSGGWICGPARYGNCKQASKLQCI
jgi:hypothetical protein